MFIVSRKYQNMGRISVMKDRNLLIATLILLFAAIVLIIGKDFWDIDTCLDDGGTWDPKKKVCLHEIKKGK